MIVKHSFLSLIQLSDPTQAFISRLHSFYSSSSNSPFVHTLTSQVLVSLHSMQTVSAMQSHKKQ